MLGFVSSASLIDDSGVIKFFGDWMDQLNQTLSVLFFKLSSSMSDEVSRSSGDVSSLNISLKGNSRSMNKIVTYTREHDGGHKK